MGTPPLGGSGASAEPWINGFVEDLLNFWCFLACHRSFFVIPVSGITILNGLAMLDSAPLAES